MLALWILVGLIVWIFLISLVMLFLRGASFLDAKWDDDSEDKKQ